MRHIQRLVAAAMLLFVAACAAPHTLSVTDVGTLGFGKVEVAIDPGARLTWPSREAAFQRAGGSTETTGRDLRTYLTEQVRQTIESSYAIGLAPELTGKRKVNLRVRVRGFIVPSLAERVLVNNHAMFAAHVDVVDAVSGDVIATYEPPAATSQAMMGGLLAPFTDALGMTGQDPGTALVAQHVSNIREWLLKR